MAKGFSRFISALLLFGMLGCVGTSVSAEETQEVQAVRRQFSTLEEVTAVQVQEEGVYGPLPAGGGGGSLRPICGYDSGNAV